MHYPQTPGSIQTWCIDAAAPDARGEFVRHADAVSHTMRLTSVQSSLPAMLVRLAGNMGLREFGTHAFFQNSLYGFTHL
jgi:hypothetical protein